MGLDMYLEKETYVKQWDWIAPEDQYEVTVTRGGARVPEIDPTRVTKVVEQVGYWRKANAIHAWFVNNVQGGVDECQRSYVPRAKLEELLDLVEHVLVGVEPAEKALPTQAGFFFGSTEYDEWYREDLELTQKILREALEGESAGRYGGEFYYQASW